MRNPTGAAWQHTRCARHGNVRKSGRYRKLFWSRGHRLARSGRDASGGRLRAPGCDRARYVFRTATAVTVRDDGSRRVLENLGIDTGKVTVASDPVFTLRGPEKSGDHIGELIARNRTQDEPLIGVCLRHWEVGVD